MSRFMFVLIAVAGLTGMAKPGGQPKPPACPVCGGSGTVTHGGVTKTCNACNGRGR